MPLPYTIPQSPIPQAPQAPALPSITDLAMQAITAIDAQQAPQRVEPIDPRKMMWAGLLSDIGQYVGDPFRYQMRGLGPAYFSNAMQYNREADAFNTQIANMGAEKLRQKMQILSMLPTDERGKIGTPVVGRNGNYWIPVDAEMVDTGVSAPLKDVYGAQGSGSGGERTKYDIKTYPDKASSTGFREFYVDPYNPGAARIPGSEVAPPADYATANRAGEDEVLRIDAQLNTTGYESKEILGKLDSALGNVSNWSTGWGSTLFSNLPESEAKKLQTDVATIKARLSKDKLQEMRAASANGASGYGQLTEKELQNLEDQVERLDPSVGPEKFRQQIDNVMRHYQMATYLIDASLRTRRQMLLDERVLPGSSVRGRTAPEFKGQVPPPMAGMAPPGGMPSANNLLMDVLTNGPASRAAQMPSPSVPPAPQGAPVSPASGALPTAEDLLRQVQGGRP